VRFLPGDGTPLKVHVPALSSVDCGNLDGVGPICYVGSYLDTGGYFRFDPKSRKLTPTALRTPPPFLWMDSWLFADLRSSRAARRIP
jgi:hypothetical protein